jgi:hypothetical protein
MPRSLFTLPAVLDEGRSHDEVLFVCMYVYGRNNRVDYFGTALALI